jgi:tyrosyl-DNA phosphodiesterase-1
MIIATMQRTISASANGEESDTEEESEVKIIEPAVGWGYVGSHNFTPSAWGTLSGSAFNPILNVRAVNLDVRPGSIHTLILV